MLAFRVGSITGRTIQQGKPVQRNPQWVNTAEVIAQKRLSALFANRQVNARRSPRGKR
jgi:hypothetical protein